MWRGRGFEANVNRGCSFFFGHSVLRRFLDENGIKALIRFVSFIFNFFFLFLFPSFSFSTLLPSIIFQ